MFGGLCRRESASAARSFVKTLWPRGRALISLDIDDLALVGRHVSVIHHGDG